MIWLSTLRKPFISLEVLHCSILSLPLVYRTPPHCEEPDEAYVVLYLVVKDLVHLSMKVILDLSIMIWSGVTFCSKVSEQ